MISTQSHVNIHSPNWPGKQGYADGRIVSPPAQGHGGGQQQVHFQPIELSNTEFPGNAAAGAAWRSSSSCWLIQNIGMRFWSAIGFESPRIDWPR